jgi:hypothetical protein
MGSKLGDAGVEEALDGVARFLEHAAVDRVARAFQREHEVVRDLVGPGAEGLGRLRAVEGAVDFDRGEMLDGVFELARVRQAFGIEDPAPGLIGPAADAPGDGSGFHAASLRLARFARDPKAAVYAEERASE